jgi:O-antigen/teichoic acid export membrane protein
LAVSGDPDALQALSATSAPKATSSGARSGALLTGASAVSIVTNYAFLLAAGRILGTASYGSLAALLGVLAVILIPAGALQMAVSREISRLVAGGETDRAHAFARRTLRLSLLATLPLVALAFAFAAPLAAVLNIDSIGVVLLAESALLTALCWPVALGVLQGSQRFRALAAMYVVPFVARLGLLAIAAAAGYRLGGALLANAVSAVGGTVLAFALAKKGLGVSARARADLKPFLRYLGPVAVGLVGIALLTHIDILVVKARFSGKEAGAYAAASAFARVGFFLPATILAVLFPRTAARQARGERTDDILGRSLLATAGFCGGLALFYAATGAGLVATTFGPDFSEGGAVLAPFALATGLFSLAYILVGYHLSRSETRYAWIVGAGVVIQVAALAVVPSSLHGVVWTNLVIGVALIAAHELFVGSSVPAVQAGLRRFTAGRGVKVRGLALEASAVVLATTVFVCLLFLPVVAHFGSTVIGSLGSDSTAGIWWLWQLQHEGGYHLFGSTHHTLSGAPFGWDEGNGLNLQWLLPYYPAYLATKVVGEVTAFNLVVFSGYVLSGVSMFLVARYLGCIRVVAAWAALAYIVFPWHLARAEHASLVHLEVLALLVFTLVAAARQASWPRFALVGLATLACWLTSGYYGVEAIIAAFAFAVGAGLTMKHRGAARLVAGAGVAAFAATALISLGSFTSGVNRGAGLHRTVEDLSIQGLRGYELVVPADGNLLLDGKLDSFHQTHLHGTNATEASNYLGLLTIGLAVAWLFVAWRRRARLSDEERSSTAGLLTVVLVGLLFAAPSPISLFGHELWMPSRLLWEAVPAFRVPSRWTPLVMTALIPLAALGLQAVWRWLSRPGTRVRLLPIAAVGLAMVISFFELTIKPAERRFRTVPVPTEYAAVERTPRGILAEYPLGKSDIYRFWQRKHGRPIVNGADPATPADEARLVLLDPRDTGTAEKLALLGVSAIIVHKHATVDVEVTPRLPSAGEGYEPVARVADGASVWRVVARPAAAFVTLPGGFAAPRRDAQGRVDYPLVSPAGVGVIQLRAKRRRVVRLSFDALPQSSATATVRITDGRSEQAFTLHGRTHVMLDVQLPLGLSQLLIKTDPAPTSEENAILFSAPLAERSSAQPALHAQRISGDPGF